jgi:ATP-dependent DNA helicase RecQ
MLAERFQIREERDVARVHEVMKFAERRGCLTQELLAYFGEDLGAERGHCDRCLGAQAAPPRRATERKLGAGERAILAKLRAEGRSALATPREVTRFLCGLSSLATIRSGLTKDPRFGVLADVPFMRVLHIVQGTCLQGMLASSSFAS